MLPILAVALWVVAAVLPLRLDAQNPRAFGVSEPASDVQRAAAAALDSAAVRRLMATGRPDSVRAAIALLNRSLETGCEAGVNLYNARTWLGVRPDVSRCIWNQDGVEGFDLAQVAAGSQSGSIYSDLVAAYFGPLRTTIATMVAASSEEDEDDSNQDEATQESRAALQRLVNGGGNLLFTAELPLVRLNLPRLNALNVVVSGSGRATTNVQALGAAAEDSASTLAAAFNVQMNLMSNNREVRVFGFWRGEYIRGDDPLLGDTVPATPSTQQTGTATRPAATGNSLAYARVSAGALLWDAVLITWTRPMFCEECDKLGIGSQVSLSFQRNTTKNGNPSGGGPN